MGKAPGPRAWDPPGPGRVRLQVNIV